MSKIRKRSRRPWLGEVSAQARLEDRFLLSATIDVSYAEAPIRPVAAIRSDVVAAQGAPFAVAAGGQYTSAETVAPLNPGGVAQGMHFEVAGGGLSAPAEPVAQLTPEVVGFGGPGSVTFTTATAAPQLFSIDPSGGGAPVGTFILAATPSGLQGGITFQFGRDSFFGRPMSDDPFDPFGGRAESAPPRALVIYFYADGSSGGTGMDPGPPAVAAPTIGAPTDVDSAAEPSAVPQAMGGRGGLIVAAPAAPASSPGEAGVGATAEARGGGGAESADTPAGAPAAAAEEPPPEAGPIAEAAPGPIGVGLRLTAPLLDVAGWDEALGSLVEGVDDLADGLGDLGSPTAALPWVVGAGVMLAASEAARRARPRQRVAASFVDGSASVVGPADDPDDRPRPTPLSRSVRRLLARGLSRWTTRR